MTSAIERDASLHTSIREVLGIDRLSIEFGLVRSILTPEPAVHEPCKHTRNQKNNEHHKVDAFDLLFVDCSQDIVETGLVPKDAPYIVRFTQTDPDEPKNRKDETNNRNRFSGGRAHLLKITSRQIVNRKSLIVKGKQVISGTKTQEQSILKKRSTVVRNCYRTT